MRRFGNPVLDDVRAAHEPIAADPTAAALARRLNLDWDADEQCLAALAGFLGIDSEPAFRAMLEGLDVRAWRYRSVAVALAQFFAIPGFTRAPTPGETKPVRWTRSHRDYLLDHVERVKRVRPRCSDTVAYRALVDEGLFRSDMSLANFRKLLQRARRESGK